MRFLARFSTGISAASTATRKESSYNLKKPKPNASRLLPFHQWQLRNFKKNLLLTQQDLGYPRSARLISFFLHYSRAFFVIQGLHTACKLPPLSSRTRGKDNLAYMWTGPAEYEKLLPRFALSFWNNLSSRLAPLWVWPRNDPSTILLQILRMTLKREKTINTPFSNLMVPL